MNKQKKGINNRQYCYYKNTICLLFFILLFLFSSCQDEENWYPDADVTIVSHYEYEPTPTTKQILVTCVIHNTSDAAITGGAVTLQIKTDKREYLQTIAVNAKIIPGGKIAVNTTIIYLDNTETVQPNGVTVYSSYFD